MSRPVNDSGTLAFIPSSYDSSNYSYSAVTNMSNGYTNSASTNYAQIGLKTGASAETYVYWVFNVTGIPENATIDSVSCTCKCSINQTSSTRVTARQVQLFAGTTAKGSATTVANNTNALSITPGSWTASEIQNARLRVYAKRGDSNTNTSTYFRFYGASLTVSYSLNGTEYEVSFNNQSSDATTDPSTTQYVYQGGSQDVKIYIDDIDDIVVKDNNVDVGSSLVQVTTGIPESEVVTAPGASYGFALDTSDGYYKSQNKGVSYSAAVCRLNITAQTQHTLTLTFVNYAEATYDYGIIGKLDNSLLTTSAVSDTSAWLWAGSASTNNSSTVKTTAITVTAGVHFVDIKFRKDDATNSNNDDFRFKYSFNEATLPNPYYKYTISNIAADHTISIDDAAGGTYYNVNASSTYAGATVSPATQSIREGRSADIQIAVNNLYEIVVKDNGTTVTSSLVQNSTGYTYTVSNVQAVHNITVEEATYYTVTTSSTYAGATATANPAKVYSGRSSEVTIQVDHLYEIIAKDNGNAFTPTEVTTSSNSNLIPSEFVQSASTFSATGTTNSPSNGLANSASTTYATFTAATTDNATVEATYKFNCSSIPANAVIDSVTCGVYCRVSNATYLPTCYANLYYGNTAKGTQTGNINATASVRTINGGSWTRTELDDINVRLTAQRGTNTSAASIRFYGATLTISYHTVDGYIYTLTNVNTNHTITIEEAPYYTISTASTYANASASVSPAKLYSGLDANITVTVPNLFEIKVKLDNNDITSSFNGSNGTYTYTLQNVTANHSLTIEEAPYYTITVNNSYQDATVTVEPSKGYYGIDVGVRIEVEDIDEIKVTDNGVSVDANIINVGNGVYRYTINAIAANHTINVTESTKYGITATSTYNAVTIEPATATVVEGKSKTFVITPDAETVISTDIILTDNGVDVTNQIVGGGDGETGSSEYYLTTFDAASSDYVGIYNNYEYTRAEGNSAAQGMANTGGTRSSFYPATGEGETIHIVYNIPGAAIPQGAILDSVTCSGTCSVAYAGSGYSQVTLQLYAGSTPKGEATTFTPLNTSSAVNVNVEGGSSWTTAELMNAKIAIHGIRNDYNSNNDDTGIRDNVNIHGATMVVHYHYPSGYNYTVSNVQSAHTLIITEVPATYYSINASSTYNEATITPATQSIRNGRSASVQISAASIYDIVVRDNGVNVNLDLVPNETGFTYTLTNIQAAHTIVVSESESFTVTTSSQYQDAQISPATQTVRQGMSAITYIDVINPAEIKVTDNDVEVTDQLVFVSAGEQYTASGILATFDEVNSDYVGIYNNYAATNAENNSSATALANTGGTRSSFYPHSGVGSELSIYYDFGEVTGIPSNAVITNVSAVVAAGGAYSGQGYSEMTVQLCKGTTPVGEPSSMDFTTSAAVAINVDGGSGWTLSDISTAKVLMHGVRNGTNSDSSNPETRDNLNICGADIIVTYTDGQSFNGYTYTIQNIQTGHTVVITENPQYTLVASSQVQDITITPASVTVRGRESATFDISGFTSEAVILDNGIDVGTQLRVNSTGHTYTVSNVQSAHTIVITEPSAEADYIKADGQYRKVLGYYKKTSGLWTLVQKAQFDAQVSSGLVFYGGVVVDNTVGEVDTSNGAINISIYDDALESGTYKMVYEDANRSPITGYTIINEFTIQ